MQTQTITRAEYMQDSSRLHHAYYLQFCTPAVFQHVANFIKRRNVRPDGWRNISLTHWDAYGDYTKTLIDRNKLREAIGWDNPHTYPWSLSDNVCIMKAAAKYLEELYNVEQQNKKAIQNQDNE